MFKSSKPPRKFKSYVQNVLQFNMCWSWTRLNFHQSGTRIWLWGKQFWSQKHRHGNKGVAMQKAFQDCRVVCPVIGPQFSRHSVEEVKIWCCLATALKHHSSWDDQYVRMEQNRSHWAKLLKTYRKLLTSVIDKPGLHRKVLKLVLHN